MRPRVFGNHVSALTVAALLVACGSTTSAPGTGSTARLSSASTTAAPSASAQRAAPPLTVGRPARVAVSVATVWRSPTSPRTVDAPALAKPARIRQWLAAMTTDQRRALSGRADTQALMGEAVTIVSLRPGWAQVVVPDQPSPLDPRGYPGWIPSRQLTARPAAAPSTVATVTRRTAWLRTDATPGSRATEISFGTVLPVLGKVGSWVRVATPLGVVRRIRSAAVAQHPPGTPAIPPSPTSLVTTAQLFTGLPYLWAGVSGFGLDCSGLTWLDHRVHGITLPRDADAQALRGTPVGWSSLRKGDLMFYATAGVVHHVTLYAGDGLMVQAPHTGSNVETVPVTRVEYAGARRFLR